MTDPGAPASLRDLPIHNCATQIHKHTLSHWHIHSCRENGGVEDPITQMKVVSTAKGNVIRVETFMGGTEHSNTVNLREERWLGEQQSSKIQARQWIKQK